MQNITTGIINIANIYHIQNKLNKYFLQFQPDIPDFSKKYSFIMNNLLPLSQFVEYLEDMNTLQFYIFLPWLAPLLQLF